MHARSRFTYPSYLNGISTMTNPGFGGGENHAIPLLLLITPHIVHLDPHHHHTSPHDGASCFGCAVSKEASLVVVCMVGVLKEQQLL